MNNIIVAFPKQETAQNLKKILLQNGFHVDAVCFTAGLGENSGFIREKICAYLGYLGVSLDPELNARRGEDLVITTKDSRTKVLMIPTNEELAIARETFALVK